MYKNIILIILIIFSFIFNSNTFANNNVRYIKDIIPIKIRIFPEKNSEFIDEAIPGEQVEIIPIERNSFAYIKKSNGKIGWVHLEFFSKKKTRYTIRSSPEIEKFNGIGYIESGESFEFIFEKNGYTQIKTKNVKTGWVLTKLLTIDKPRVSVLEKENKSLQKELLDQVTSFENLNKRYSECENTKFDTEVEQKYKKLLIKYYILIFIIILLILYLVLPYIKLKYRENKKITTI